MFEQAIFDIRSTKDFNSMALALFRHQYEHVQVYRKYCQLRQVEPKSVQSIQDIPFLPIQFFKDKDILAEGEVAQQTFTSSGTSGSIPSKHHVSNLALYERSFLSGFRHFYGDPAEYAILALLPSYLERQGSSLIYMVDKLIELSEHPQSGFFLKNTEDLIARLKTLEADGQKTLLIGVSFALLDLVEAHSLSLKHTIVMETGGMKGRRKELVRQELHDALSSGFGVSSIHSEYGMTELLSQAYSKGEGRFYGPPWMKVLTRNTENPLEWVTGTTGGVNVIDLSNVHSCAFIETQDLGKVHDDGSFEILGRFDTSDIRGCNLMAL